jgi:hypothetical protein
MDGDFEFELKPQRRDFPRWDVDVDGTVSVGDRKFACRLTDISATGASANMSDIPDMGAQCMVEIPTLGVIDAKVVRIDGPNVGFHFTIDEDEQDRLADRLASTDIAS